MKKENTRTLTKIAEKKGYITVLEELIERVNYLKEDYAKDFCVIGKEEQQATDKDGNLRWEDDACTIPYYKDKWGYKALTIDDMDDETYAKYIACGKLLAMLENLI